MGLVNVVLLSTYELGHQPFGLASPAAWLRKRGYAVTCVDLSRETPREQTIRDAGLIAFYVPMHTATRLVMEALPSIRRINLTAHLCAYGLYAALSADVLRAQGIATFLGGEFEQGLVDLAEHLSRSSALPQIHALDSNVSRIRLKFQVPDRTGLPPLREYAHLVHPSGEHRVAGYTEASRGCKHLCRHCPVVPVYQGRFRIVQPAVVLEDIRRQVEAGAQHITFGDPDFLNGPVHAERVVDALHRQWPELTYDVTVKVEHLLAQREMLPRLKATGCAFVTSAVESFDDAVLGKFAKGHTYGDFVEALRLMRAADLPLSPTFIPFTPWTTYESYRDFLRRLVELDLATQAAPIQLAIRLLIPEGSLLLELPEIRDRIQPFDTRGLCYPWRSCDPKLDELCLTMQAAIQQGERRCVGRAALFERIWEMAGCGTFPGLPLPARATIPYLTEPWYC